MTKRMITVIVAVMMAIALTALSVSAAENAQVTLGKQVAIDAEKMTFPTDGSNYEAVCPVHGTKVVWNALTSAEVAAGFTAAEANTHYYLTDSVEADGANFTMANSSKYTCCLHLNGKKLVNTGGVAIEGAAGALNIMGSGTVKGNGAADSYSSAATVLMGNVGSVNLYGGTYEKQTPADATNTAGIGWGGGTIAVYSGATIKAGTAGSAVYMDATMGVADATLNICGGTIDGTGATARVIYAKEVGNSNANKLSINLYDGIIQNGGAGNVQLSKNTVMNMYDGMISGGTGSYGGNVYIDGGEFNLHDGTVIGGVATNNGGNIYITNSGVMNMSGGTVSGTRDANGNATGGVAAKGGNISLYTNAVLNATGGTIKDGTASSDGGNISGNPSTSKVTYRCYINLSNVTISGGVATSYGGNLGLNRTTATIGEGTLITGGKARRGGNIRLYYGEITMTGGKLAQGSASDTGYDEIHLEAASSGKSIMYMLGGVIEGKETENASVRVNAYSEFYLGGTATIANKNSGNYELYIYSSGKLCVCDGWTGSAAVDGNGITWSSGASISTSKIQVVTLDKDLKATAGGRFTGKLLNIATGAILMSGADANGTMVVGGFAVVDKDGNVTMTSDPLTLWETGDYAFIRLFTNYEVDTTGKNLWIDLNGLALTATGNGTVNVFDTSSDAFAVPKGSVTADTGVTVSKTVDAPNGNKYIALEQDGKLSFHRLQIRISSVSLRPTAAGIYYKAVYNCDQTLAKMVDAYGVVLSVQGMPGAEFQLTQGCVYTVAAAPFESGIVATSGSVFGIMKDSREPDENRQYGEIKIYANPYIQIGTDAPVYYMGDEKNANKTVDSEGFDGIALSLLDVLNIMDERYSDYAVDTRRSIDRFYESWQDKGMGDWSFVNIGSENGKFDNSSLKFEEGSNQAICPACKTEVTWTPFSQPEDSKVGIGTATNGAHYYLTEDITYTGTSAGFIANPTVKNEMACLHLNGHDVTATAYAAIYTPYAHAGILNVMGNGTVSGNRSGAGATIYLSSKDAAGRINLYGGTYVEPTSNGNSMVAIINGGSIHIYDGAWIKGNGSGNAFYMDLAKNAKATFGVHGGKVTGGEVATAADAGTKARSVVVDGNAYVEEMTIRNTDTAVEISGSPVIDCISLKECGKLTIGTLEEGASITVSTSKEFTDPLEKAQAYVKYFHAWNTPDSITVSEAGALYYSINYEHYMTPYQYDVKAKAIEDGQIHYYFMAAKGMIMSPTNAGDRDKWGDGCLVVFPNGETMLIDTGYAIQAPVFVGSLKRMGVTTLDYLVITHPHGDHMGGAFTTGSTFLDEIAVEQVYYQDLHYGGTWDGVLESKCEAKDIPYSPLWTGDMLVFGEGSKAVTMTMLWPGEDADLTIDSATNKNSMVFRFDYGEHSSLFTADIYDYTDKKLIAMYTNGELDVDLMKIPHHGLGTNTSSVALLAAVTPEIAVATGSFDISSTIKTRYDDVGATLLEDRFHGYIHISSGTDGVMTTETE